MQEMFSQLGTPAGLKQSLAMPATGHHVIGSYIKSKDIAGVEKECERFLREVVKMR
jgi:hypothetical protein